MSTTTTTFILDPYEITSLIHERITAFERAGALASTTPEEEYGYTCEAVFGVCTDEIAAVRADGGDLSASVWFCLSDGRLIPAVPVPCDPVQTLWRRVEH